MAQSSAARNWSLVALAAALLLAAGALIVWRQLPSLPPETAAPLAPAAGPEETYAPPLAPSLSEIKAAATIATPKSSAPNPARERPARSAEIAPAPIAVAPAAAAPVASPAPNPAIAEATIKALTRGKPTRWKADGDKGVVVVSEPQAYAGRVCRNAYSTNAGGDRSPVRMWCRPAGGDWSPF